MGNAQTEGADAAGRLPWRVVKYVKIVRFIIGVESTSNSLRSSKLPISIALRQFAGLVCRRPSESGVLASWSPGGDPMSPSGILLGGGARPFSTAGGQTPFPHGESSVEWVVVRQFWQCCVRPEATDYFGRGPSF